jgi:hypothetical protein
MKVILIKIKYRAISIYLPISDYSYFYRGSEDVRGVKVEVDVEVVI